MIQKDTKVKIRSTGQIGYIANIDEISYCVRTPSEDGWPFPSYQWVLKCDVVRMHDKKELPDVGDAPF